MLVFSVGMALFFLLMLGIGLAASRRVFSLDDYLIANRRLPLWLAVPTIVATWFGAGSCMGVSGTVYREGFYGVLADPFGCFLALVIAGLFFAGPFRRKGLVTISDLLAQAYGARFEFVATALMLPFYIGTLASQMVAMGYFYQVTAGGSPETGMLLGSLIVVAYTLSGGMWAVTITDFVQLALVGLGLAIVFYFALSYNPQPAQTWSLFQSELGSLWPRHQAGVHWLAYGGRLAMTGLGAIMGQDLIQRCLASRTPRIAQTSSILAGFCYLALGLVPLYIGLAGRYLLPDLENSELLLPLLAQKYLDPWCFMLFACGLLAAVMSTADSYLLAGSSLLMKNIVLRRWDFGSDEKSKIKIVRLINAGISALALALALSGQSIFSLMVHSGAILFVAILVPVSAALFLANPSRRGAWSAAGVGLAAWAAALWLQSRAGVLDEDGLFAAASVGALASLAAYLPFAILATRQTSSGRTYAEV